MQLDPLEQWVYNQQIAKLRAHLHQAEGVTTEEWDTLALLELMETDESEAGPWNSTP